MKKIKINCPWYIILVIFGVFAFSAVCWFNFIKGFKSQTDSADKSVIEKVDECVDNIDTKWSDSIFQKKILSRVDSIYTYYSTKEISSSQVFKGKEKWLFYKSIADGDPMGEYEGKKVFTDDEMKTTLKSCLETQNELDKRGIKSLIFVSPNKENVYYEYIPETYVRVNETRTDKLLKYLSENGVNVVNPKKEIISASKDNQLYYWYDTHWNQLGGYLGVKCILDKWNIEIAPLSERKINSKNLFGAYHISGEDDLAKMVGLREIAFNDDIEYSVDGTKEIDWNAVSLAQQNEEVYHITNSSAKNKATVLLVGDSCRVAMLPSLCEAFTDVYVLHRSYYNTKMLDEISPNYLISEYVERFSSGIGSISSLVE